MRIVVCVKHAPDIYADRALDAEGHTIRGEDDELNELDEHAIEAAVTLVEEHGGEVVALTMGPEQAVDAARRGLQLGVGQAIHVSDEQLLATDVLGTATVLAAAIKKIGENEPIDLVMTGMASLDGLTSMLPAALAAKLDLPPLLLATEVSIDDGRAIIRREIGEAVQRMAAPLPALVSITDQAQEARYPDVKAIKAARQKPLETWSLADIDVPATQAGLAGATTEILEGHPRPPREQGRIVTDSGDGGQQLADYLIAAKLV